ncbi:hypothetical protein BDR26DRAFT_75035 [Obelidium mucronatum]|nr:hypothetical protein BDR26DRAFT_75035 [Obelidium mucronatum]
MKADTTDSHLDLGLRLVPSDYTAPMSGNKNKIASVYTEKQQRASVSGRRPSDTTCGSAPRKTPKKRLSNASEIIAVESSSMLEDASLRDAKDGGLKLPVFVAPTSQQHHAIEMDKDKNLRNSDVKLTAGKGKWGAIKASVAISSALRVSRASQNSATAHTQSVTIKAGEAEQINEESATRHLPTAAPEQSRLEVPKPGRKNSITKTSDDSIDVLLGAKIKSAPFHAETPEPKDVESTDKKEYNLIRPIMAPDLKKSIKEEFKGRKFVLWALLPAFDNKGRTLDLEQFDKSDFEDASFSICGLHPRSHFNSYWDFGMTLSYFAIIWLIPFCVCFELTALDDAHVPALDPMFSEALSILYTIVFLLDSLVSIVTPQPLGVYSMCSFRDYELSREPLNEWMVTWSKKYLFLQLISLLPFDIIFSNRDAHVFLQLLRFFRLYRLPQKISRCAIYKKLTIRLEKSLGNGVTHIVPICVIIIFVIHMNACMMFLLGKWARFVGWEIAWEGFATADLGAFYAWTFYQTMGNMLPMSFMFHTTGEQVLGVISMVVGSVMFATFIGSISAATLSHDTSGRLYNQKMDELKDYMKWKNVSDETRHKLISYYETKYRGKYFEEDSLLADMNDSLRTEVSLHNTRKLIEQVPFLRRSENDGRDELFFRTYCSGATCMLLYTWRLHNKAG